MRQQMTDHAPRIELQSSHDKKRQQALRWLTDNGKHIYSPGFRYTSSAKGSAVLANIRRRAR